MAAAGGMALRADAQSSAAAPVPRPLVTAVFPSTPPESALIFRRIRGAGATVTRFALYWSHVARKRPETAQEARDPAFAGYDWRQYDQRVRWAVASGLRPLLTFQEAPSWAHKGPDYAVTDVDGAAFANFARAAATRYSGRYAGLPRVRYWMVWNEPNLGTYLNPQFREGKPYAPLVYRDLVNRVADAVHGVRSDNLVVAGGTAPFTAWTKDSKERWGMGPLTFMRAMLCLSQTRKPKPVCSARAKFDVWAHHPYTSGGPTHHAFRPDDVSLGDLPEMRAVLDAAIQYRRIASRATPQFWVTEFSWDTKPPDPGGLSLTLHGRWAAEALYQMWKSRVSLVTWWGIRDQSYPAFPFQSGLYLRGSTIERDRPKPAFRAFRFPFVAYPRGGGVLVWGRVPSSRTALVRIEQKVGAEWRSLAVRRADRYGIFAATLPRRGRGVLRARAGAETSLSFSLTSPSDRFLYPFGDWHP